MKKLISFCVLLLIGLYANAQSADETLEWLRAKQPAITGNTISFTDTGIKLTNQDKDTFIQWSKIKDVTARVIIITVVGDEVIDGKNVFIRFSTDNRVSDQFVKALKHLAGLKNARLIKDDLFQK